MDKMSRMRPSWLVVIYGQISGAGNTKKELKRGPLLSEGTTQ